MFLFFFLTDEHISDQGLKGLRNEATEDLLYAGVFCYSIVTIFQGTNLTEADGEMRCLLGPEVPPALLAVVNLAGCL